MHEGLNFEGQRVQGILDNIIRITEGLMEAKVSFDTLSEYLLECTAELDPETTQRVLIFSILDIIQERMGRNED